MIQTVATPNGAILRLFDDGEVSTLARGMSHLDASRAARLIREAESLQAAHKYTQAARALHSAHTFAGTWLDGYND
mgnify:CR=1 FL=1